MSEKNKLILGYVLLSLEILVFGYFALGKIFGWF